VMICYVLTLAVLVGIGLNLRFHWPYWLGLLVAAAIAAYHFTLIRKRARDKCFRAFLHNNWFGAAIFVGIVGQYLFTSSRFASM